MRTLVVSLVLLAVPGLASAQEKKPESSVGDAAQSSKIWTKSEPRGQATKK